MVLNKFTGSTLMDGNEDDLFKVFGTTLKHFASYVYLKALQVGDSIRIRVYDKVDDVSRYKLDGDVNDSVGSNNGTITNISSWVSQWKFDGNANDSVGSNNGTITYNTNLKRLYKFESNLNDSTTNANASLTAGTATYVTGREGSAFSFDGSTYLTAADTGLPNGNNIFSVSTWVNFGSFASNPIIFDYGTHAGTHEMTLYATTDGKLNVYNGANYKFATVLSLNTWYYVTVTYDGTTLKLYINGVLDTSTFTTTFYITLSTSTIGGYFDGTQKLTGYLDELRVYNITLSQAQVSALYMNGKFAQSHTFDGGEYVSKTSPIGIPTGSTDRSVSFWINLPALPATKGSCLVYGTAVANQVFGVFIDTSGHVVAEGYANDVTSNTILSLGVWNHIVVTVSSSGTVRTIYINGVQDKQSTTTAINTSSGTIYIGFDGVDSLGANIAQIDEMRIYNVALTASQVLGLYNYTGSNYVSPLPVGNALSLDGSSYVTVTNQTPYNFERTNAFSTSFWIKTTQTSYSTIIGKGLAGGGGANWSINLASVSAGTITFEESHDNTGTNILRVTSTSTVNDGNWHNVIITYDGSSTPAGIKFYIDGILNSGTTNLNTLSLSILNSANVIIGTRSDFLTPLKGLLDEVQIYNYVLSSAEIFNINAGRFGNTHPIGLWHFDGDLYDYSGQGSTGIPTGTIEYVTGALSGSYTIPNEHFNFDGSETVVITNPANIQFEINNPFTVAFWLKTTNTNASSDGYVSKSHDGTDPSWYVSKHNAADNLDFVIYNGTTYFEVDSNTIITDGKWHHIVCTYSGNMNKNGMNIYVDGALDNTGGSAAITGTMLNSDNIVIGGFYNTTADIAIAEIDDVRIINRAFSAGEVLDLFNYPDSPMKELVYDRTYSGVKTDDIYVPMLQGNQYKVTCQQILGTNRIIPWERFEVT